MNKRNFLTTTTAANMLEKAKGLDLKVSEETLTVNDLKGIDFISTLTNKQLSNYLIERGIKSATLGQGIKILCQEGDDIYLVNPGVKLHELEKKGWKETLPPYASVTITKILVRKSNKTN